MKKGFEIREEFIKFFVERGHASVKGSPLIPPDDPTMLFTSAGMVQFKPLYAGLIALPYTRATTVQKCLRAGGKGSDLENVGKTLRHHTFFEMLGNFSFGDYFKREAIRWAWEFATEILKLPKERLFPTIFRDDDEATGLWREETDCHYEPARLDEKENFWGPAGDTGACGPCSEICFFMGSRDELEKAKTLTSEERALEIVKNGDLYLEIWNMVFPQFDQQTDGSRPPLKNRGIDTGAGLERMTTVTQFIESEGRVRSPYETDLLSPIVERVSHLTGLKYERIVEQMAREGKAQGELANTTSAKIRLAVNAIADHVRALCFALTEGILPSNDGRGYVLRRILRRASRLAYLQGIEKPFMYEVVDAVSEVMGRYYPEIIKSSDHIKKVIKIEEERFLRTLAQGERFLDEMIAKASSCDEKKISGKNVFLLHATYGFPPDLTVEIAQDSEIGVDKSEYEAEMKKHREDAKKSWKGNMGFIEEEEILDDIFDTSGHTVFTGYSEKKSQAKILAIIKEGVRSDSISQGDDGIIILDKTPFYAESGGQVGDTGELKTGSCVFDVSDTKKTQSSIFMHIGKCACGVLKIGETISAEIDAQRRLSIARNHTATHLLQGALKRIIGAQIAQQGSSVTQDGFRFDFTHIQSLSADEIEKIEDMVNAEILANSSVRVETLNREEALKMNVIAPFGEKYGEIVRVVRIGDFSAEFCGGTHLEETSIIGSFAIVNEASISSGVRRIEAVTGFGAREFYRERKRIVGELCRMLTIKPEDIIERVEKFQSEIKALKKSVSEAKQKSSSGSADDIIAKAIDIKGVKFISHIYKDLAAADMRNTADVLRGKANSGAVVLLGSDSEGKALLLCAITDDLKGKVHAGNLIKEIVKLVGGGGGGKPDLAQAGGKEPEKLPEALKEAEQYLLKTL